MRVTIHQPEHLPWLGFFAKMASADRLILLDSVPYRHHYFQNRNRLARNGEATWLTVPVRHRGHLRTAIADIAIDDGRPWRRSYLGRLRDCTRGTPHGDEIVPAVDAIIARDWRLLVDLNQALIELLAERLAIDTPIALSSALDVPGMRTELLVGLCRASGASTYLSGPSGRDYLDRSCFAAAGIELEFFEFDHPAYPQAGWSRFVPALSAVDPIANVGVEESRRLLRGASGERFRHADGTGAA